MKNKIICTIGPSSNSEEVLRDLVKAGMSIARINCSHGSIEQNEANIELVKKVRKDMGVPVSIMLDTKGPEIRIGHFDPAVKVDGGVWLEEGQTFTLQTRPTVGFENRVFVDYKKLPKVVKPGQQLLLNDGLIVMTVVSMTEFEVICRVNAGGRLGDRKSLFVPGCDLGLSFISKADELDLIMGCKTDVDWVAASFVNCAEDVIALKKVVNKYGKDIPVISKIESKNGVENIDEILAVTDGIMVARGDLGVEYPIEQIPTLQKMLIKKARAAGKLVVTATEMLESMIEKVRPTRAETTDVANSLYDGTSCTMLSGETASGKHPVKVVQFMKRIAELAESFIDRKVGYRDVEIKSTGDAFACTLTHAAVNSKAKAICAFTRSGRVARAIANFYPPCPIYAFANNERVYHMLAAYNGVIPVLMEQVLTTHQMLQASSKFVMENKIAAKGDVIIVASSFQDSKTDLVLMHPLT